MPAHPIKQIACYLVAAVAITACSALPPAPETEDSFANTPANEGPLALAGTKFSPPLAHGESAFHLIPAAQDALSWRLALIDNAVQSIDAQYYVWKDDAVGALVINRLLQAADRGVQVRILVDDMHLATEGTFSSSDRALAALDYHPNLQLRLFNPGKYRDGTVGALESLGTRFSSYNRRMHNKLLVADNQFAIVGGRNIGNEYHGLDPEHNFIDLDSLVNGAIITDTSDGFDVFWNSELAYPAHALAVVNKSDYENLREDNREFLLQNSKLLAPFLSDGEAAQSRLQHITGVMHRGSAVFLEKLPEENAEEAHHLYDRLNELAGSGGREILSSTPYLIPVEGFLELLKLDEESGTQVSFLTNSLASNNQRTVHSQYKKYRREILDTGAELYELNHQPVGELHRYIDTAPGKSDTITLHMKATVIDGQRCFIGTLNLDPRSIEINTEDVMYIESAELCGELRDYIAEIMLPDNAWQVSKDDDGDLQWKSHAGTTTQQPAQKFSDRVMDFLYGILPMEKQL